MHYYNYNGPWNNGAAIGFHIFGFSLFMFLLILFAKFCFAGRFYHHRSMNFRSNSDAVETVRQRYAKGEISKQEYDKLLADLKKNYLTISNMLLPQ